MEAVIAIAFVAGMVVGTAIAKCRVCDKKIEQEDA